MQIVYTILIAGLDSLNMYRIIAFEHSSQTLLSREQRCEINLHWYFHTISSNGVTNNVGTRYIFLVVLYLLRVHCNSCKKGPGKACGTCLRVRQNTGQGNENKCDS